MKDFLKILIHPLDILKIGWLKKKQLNYSQLDGTNEIERELPFLIELTDQFAIEDFLLDSINYENKIGTYRSNHWSGTGCSLSPWQDA